MNRGTKNTRIPEVDALLAKEAWHAERKKLRVILLDRHPNEKVKSNKLCYTFEDSNVVIIYGLKDYCALGFLKGSLLDDPGEYPSCQIEEPAGMYDWRERLAMGVIAFSFI